MLAKTSVFPGAVAVLLATSLNARATPRNPLVIGNARFSVLSPNCIRIESASKGRFVDDPSLFAVNRAARFDGFKIEHSGKTTILDTGAIRLKFSPDGGPLSAANLSATIQNGSD